jgi:alpha-galactosidase
MLQDFKAKLNQLPIWKGEVELRGLENREYSVYDFETDEPLGTVQGPTGVLNIAFRDHLIIRATPE